MSKKVSVKQLFSQMTTKATDEDHFAFETLPDEIKIYGRLPPQMIKAVLSNGITLELMKAFGYPTLPKLKRGHLQQLQSMYTAMEAGFLKRDGKVVNFYEETLKGMEILKTHKQQTRIRRRFVNASPSYTPPAADSPLEPSTPGNLFHFGEQTMSCEKTFRSMQSEDFEKHSSDSSQGSVTEPPSKVASPQSPTKEYKNYCEDCKDDCVLSPNICNR